DPRLVMIAAGGSGPRVVLVNDTARPWTGRLTVRTATATASWIALEQPVEVAPHRSWSVALEAGEHLDAVAVIADLDGRRAERWLRPDVDLILTRQDALVVVAPPVPDGEGGALIEVTVEARTLLRDLSLLAELELPGAVVPGQPGTLLPGERVTVPV